MFSFVSITVQLCFYYLHALVLISLTGYSLTSHSVQLFPNWFTFVCSMYLSPVFPIVFCYCHCEGDCFVLPILS